MVPFGGLILAALLVTPFWKLLPRYGIHKAWAFAAIVPIGLIALLWIMAFREDPGRPAGA